MRSDIAAEAVDAAFEELATAAIYTPPAGAPADCSIMLLRPDDTVTFGSTRAVVGTVVIEVRASEVAQPRRGGTFEVDDVVFAVLSEPEAKDPVRLVWRCQAEERTP